MSKLKLRLLVTALCSVIFSSCSAKEKVIGIGENIHHDDFEYSVQHLERVKEIGSLRARGTFFVAAFQVENRAKRVDHQWSNNISYIIDEKGIEYGNEPEAQKELNRIKPFGYKPQYVTPAGAAEMTMLVFDVPDGVKEPFLKVRGFLLMGDVFDLNQYRRTRVKLF